MSFADRGAYDPRAEAGGVAGETGRLEAQTALSWPQEQAILRRLHPGPDPRVLEVGSGTGAVTRRLLDAWPEARVTALEPDADLLAVAARALAADLAAGRLSLAHGSIDHNTLAGKRFDLIVVRYVLQHLADPVAAVRALAPLLSPGGRLVAIEVDAALWGAAEPTDPALAAIHAAASATHGRQGGDRLIGRRLWRILRQAGYGDCRLESFCYHSDELGLAAFEPQLSPERLLPAVTAGDLAFADYLRLVEAHQRFMRDPDAFVLMLGFAAHGRWGDG